LKNSKKMKAEPDTLTGQWVYRDNAKGLWLARKSQHPDVQYAATSCGPRLHGHFVNLRT
jgi:hypothetical protein